MKTDQPVTAGAQPKQGRAARALFKFLPMLMVAVGAMQATVHSAFCFAYFAMAYLYLWMNESDDE